MRQTALTIFAVLFATSPGSATPLPISKANITGAWTVPGGDCDGDTTEVYSANGRYGTDNSEGRWALHGNKLIITVIRAGEMSEPFIPVRPPERSVITVIRVDRRTLTAKYYDGSVRRSHRCR